MTDLTPAVARLDGLHNKANSLRSTLPRNCATAEDTRALLVWSQAERRYLEVYCKELVMTIIPGLEEVKPGKTKAEKITNVGKGRRPDKTTLRELGRCIKDLERFCDRHVAPTVARLKAGMDRIEALPLSREADAEHARFLGHWLKLRKEVSDALPHAWRIAVAARELYEELDDDQRTEAIGTWGPLRGRESWDYGPLIRRGWPADEIADLDRRAQLQGIVDLDHPFPNARYDRRQRGKD